MPAGRPTDYTSELGDEICRRIASPMSLSKVCQAADMPGMSAVFAWLRKYPEFTEQYQRAIEERTEAQAEEILDISDDSSIDPKRARLMVDTRKWLMSKMKPKKYGEKVTTELTGADGAPVQYVVRMPEVVSSVDEWLQKSK